MKQSIVRLLAVGLILGAVLGSTISMASAVSGMDIVQSSSHSSYVTIIYGVINDGGGLTNRGPIPPWDPLSGFQYEAIKSI